MPSLTDSLRIMAALAMLALAGCTTPGAACLHGRTGGAPPHHPLVQFPLHPTDLLARAKAGLRGYTGKRDYRPPRPACAPILRRPLFIHHGAAP